ncbi:22354_t:CDS:1, partial [Gigaspora rosea]
VQEFTTCLSRNPSLLDMLIVRRQSENLASFRDFNIQRTKIAHALSWLKANYHYYADITIDNEVLQFLPDNASIDNWLKTISGNLNDNNEDDLINDAITYTFVPSLSLAQQEDEAISNTLNRMQNESGSVMWPHISNNSINEFQTQG